MSASKYERSSIEELDGSSGAYFVIPSSIILRKNKEIGDRLVTVFSFFSVNRGLNWETMFSLNKMVEWCGKNPDRHSGGVNTKFKKTVEFLEDEGYLCLKDNVSNSICCTAVINKSKITEECQTNKKRFATVYLDEVEKILSWQNPNKKDVYVNPDVLIRVFSYLRMMISRRPNKLSAQEIGEDIEKRMLRLPEAYNGYYCDMASDLDITPRAFSESIKVLKEIGLIYYESLPRVKVNGKWITTHTIFCNAYKREGKHLFASGEDYYGVEIRNKKKILRLIDNNGCFDENGGV